MYCLAVGPNCLIELLLGEVSSSQIAEVGSSLIIQFDCAVIFFDGLAVFFRYVIDDAQVVAGVGILPVVLDGALEIFLGILVMLQLQFGNPELIEEDRIVRLLL